MTKRGKDEGAQSYKPPVPEKLLKVEEESNDPDKTDRKKLKVVKKMTDELAGRKLIVILEAASLEIVKNGERYELLSADKHRGLAKKYNRDPANCRPDICHQGLLMLLDSPLNKAGLLQVFVRTDKNVLFWVHPQCRIPRTFDRFCGLMTQLLHKLVIKAEGQNKPLMKVIRNPVSDHLPPGCAKYAMSLHAGLPIDPIELVPTGDNDGKPVVVVIGSIAHGSIDPDYVDRHHSISSYPLSSALTCAKVCSAFEKGWGIL